VVTLVTKLEIADGKAKAVKPIEGAQLLIESQMPVSLPLRRD
jgi:hypothetical protein